MLPRCGWHSGCATALTAYGIPRSSYVGHGTGLVARSDLGTLNLSDVPVAMIEVGNMRNRAMPAG